MRRNRKIIKSAHSNRFVLVAHCVHDEVLTKKSWNLKGVRLGEWNLLTNPDCDDDNICAPPSVDFAIMQRIVHENFVPFAGNQHFDIALLKLAGAARFSEFIKPICLPFPSSANEEFDGLPLVVAGFGKTETKDSSNKKLKTEIRGLGNDFCQNSYNPDLQPISKTQMCALGKDGKDSW